MNAFHMIGLTQAFWNAVLVNRGGSQSSASRAGLMKTIPKPKPQVHDRLGLRFVQRAHRVVDVLRRLRDRRLGDDANTLAATGFRKFFR